MGNAVDNSPASPDVLSILSTIPPKNQASFGKNAAGTFHKIRRWFLKCSTNSSSNDIFFSISSCIFL